MGAAEVSGAAKRPLANPVRVETYSPLQYGRVMNPITVSVHGEVDAPVVLLGFVTWTWNGWNDASDGLMPATIAGLPPTESRFDASITAKPLLLRTASHTARSDR